MLDRYSVLCCVLCLLACESADTPPDVAGDAGALSRVSVDAGRSIDAGESFDVGAEEDASSPALEEPSSTPEAPQELLELCDGSKDLRLIWQKKDEIQAITHPFVMRYGAAIFGVDGQCRFFASRDIREGFMTGTLSTERARDLGRDLAFTEVSRSGAPVFYPRTSSLDFPVEFLATRDSMVSCTCGCPPQAPQAIADAFSQSVQWLDRLLKLGKPLTPSAVGALAIVDKRPADPMLGETRMWPLMQSMADVPGLVLADIHDRRWSKGPYARIEGAAEVAALRALRAVDLVAFPYPTEGMRVVDGANAYRFYARDELPDQLGQAVEAFLAHAAQIPRTP